MERKLTCSGRRRLGILENKTRGRINRLKAGRVTGQMVKLHC
jgi:hypothetical protein